MTYLSPKEDISTLGNDWCHTEEKDNTITLFLYSFSGNEENKARDKVKQ